MVRRPSASSGNVCPSPPKNYCHCPDRTLGRAGSPDWSPDRKHNAFDIYSGVKTGSYIINADSTTLRYLGTGIMPTFRPRGARLAFTWSGRGMALMDAIGQSREVLTCDDWHPNGTCILLAKTSPKHLGGPGLHVYDLTTGEITLLETHPLDMPNHSGIWSLDDKQIAFVGRRNPEPLPFRGIAALTGRASPGSPDTTAPTPR